MKFKTKTKGRITQYFANNHEDADRVTHTGIDWVKGYGSPVLADNAGFVYKLYRPDDRDDNWSAVYVLTPYKDHFIEVCHGHLSFVPDIGEQNILEGQFVGLEGNCGRVYSGGVRITPDMQRAGDKRGSHVHESYRPVRRVRSIKDDMHYLIRDGKKYRDQDGCYYEIIHTNETRGCVDPMLFGYTDTIWDKLRIGLAVLTKLKKAHAVVTN